jgi:tRNA A37 threonylcarbamoyladenosine synthetase subunit TsaC/SUA5/YrdC
MDRTASASRLPLVTQVGLAQTDTTVGFVSQNEQALARIKKRPVTKPFLKTFASFKAYKPGGRVPSRFKREVRRSKRTTYIIKNEALRIVSEGAYHELLKPYGWLCSTSANASGAWYDAAFAFSAADIVIENSRGLFEAAPSRIYKLNRTKKRRIR